MISHLWWYRTRKKQRHALNYIHQKLNQMIEQKTKENLLLFTEDRQIQRLLVDLNQLLHHSHQTMATYNKLEQSIRRMLTNMSHDLKTPLTVILGLSETLTNDDTLSQAQRQQLLKKIHVKAQAIQKLINQFFDLAKLESGDTKLTYVNTELNEICRSNLLFFYEQITAQGLDVAIEIPKTPIYAYIDPAALDRILKNLIANAIHYGSDGQIVGIRLWTNDHYAYIDVWDCGKGIDEKEQNLIFERLYTLENQRNQGSGLGLAITKQLVEKLSGTLTIKSKPWEQTVFTVQFKRVFPTEPS